MAISLVQINTAIHDTFANNLTTIDYTQNYDDLTEGLANTPLLQVYWNALNPVSEGSNTDRRTFGGQGVKPVRTKRYIFRADLYGDARGNLDSQFAQLYPIVDEINDILEDQDDTPFDLEGIKSYTWSCERGNIEYANVSYPVVQWTIEIYVF